MSELLYSSAVLTMSQTTEFIRNKSVDNVIINLIVQRKITDFSIQDAYQAIQLDLPIRLEEIEKSFMRSVESGSLKISSGTLESIKEARFKIPDESISKIDASCSELRDFLTDSINELFEGLVNDKNRERFKDLLLEVVTKLMAKYGYAYAGQLAGVTDATEFVPIKELKEICEHSIKKYEINISVNEFAEAIGILFDRRDPCLNNLAFSICNRYYVTRLIGLDLPIDFIARNLYEGSTIYLDTNVIMTIVYAKSKRHNEFREILKKADEIGISFSVSHITLAEIQRRVSNYKEELEKAEEIIPEDLLAEVQGEIVEKSENGESIKEFKIEESAHAIRLGELGVKIDPPVDLTLLYTQEELENLTQEIAEFDRKYRHQYPPKNDNALFHDAYMYFLIRKKRSDSEHSAWFLSLDNSMIEHAISKKEGEPSPYAIRLFSLLQTLSQFVESQALKGEFSDLFGELISKDLLPRESLFSLEDLKLLIGFDIKAKEIPPEFVRKATTHIKKNILKGGQLTDKNRSEAIHEFTKFLATPDQNFVEIRKKYDKKLRDRDEDIKRREIQLEEKQKEIGDYQKELDDKKGEIETLKDQVKNLRIDQQKDRHERELDKYNEKKQSYIETEWEIHRKSQWRLRFKYIAFLTIAIALFTTSFFTDQIILTLGWQLEIQNWINYGVGILIFLAPFIRSFFEHKKVIHAFMFLSKRYRVNSQEELKKLNGIDFEKVHKRPELNLEE